MTQPKLRVGVSSCLLGQEVRYDGGHRRDDLLIELLGPRVEWVAVCPEIEIGLGTPRPPIELQEVGGSVRLIMPSTGRDLTAAMGQYAARKVAALAAMGLSGYVLKARSPSCGLGSAPVLFGTAADGRDSGIFAAVLRARFPDLPVAEESDLSNAAAIDAFMARVQAYRSGRG